MAVVYLEWALYENATLLTEQIALRGDSMEIVRERGKFLACSPKAL